MLDDILVGMKLWKIRTLKVGESDDVHFYYCIRESPGSRTERVNFRNGAKNRSDRTANTLRGLDRITNHTATISWKITVKIESPFIIYSFAELVRCWFSSWRWRGLWLYSCSCAPGKFHPFCFKTWNVIGSLLYLRTHGALQQPYINAWSLEAAVLPKLFSYFVHFTYK